MIPRFVNVIPKDLDASKDVLLLHSLQQPVVLLC